MGHGHDHEHDQHSCGCGCGGHASLGPASQAWAEAPDDALVCPCLGLKKADILAAISAGAITLPLLKVMTGAGRGIDCQRLHPQGRSCEADLAALVHLYARRPAHWPQGGCEH